MGALLPIYPCFKQPQGRLRHVMEGPTHVLGFLQQGQTTVMFSQDDGVDVWLNTTGELLQRIAVKPEQKLDKVLLGHMAEFVLVGYFSHLQHTMEVSVVSTETGVDLVNAVFPENFEAIALSEEDNLLVVATTIEADNSPMGSAQRCLLAVDVRSKDVVHTIPIDDVHQDGVTRLLFAAGSDENEHYILTFGSKVAQDLSLWDLEEEKLEFTLPLNVFVEHVQLHGAMAICASPREGVLLFVDLNEGKLVSRIDESDLVNMADMVVSNNGQFVCIATAESGINVYSREQLKVIKNFGERLMTSSGSRIAPTKMCIDHRERFVVVGYSSGEIIVYWLANGQTVLRLKGVEGHTKRINSLLMNSSDVLFSASDDKVAKMWNLASELSAFEEFFLQVATFLTILCTIHVCLDLSDRHIYSLTERWQRLQVGRHAAVRERRLEGG